MNPVLGAALIFRLLDQVLLFESLYFLRWKEKAQKKGSSHKKESVRG